MVLCAIVSVFQKEREQDFTFLIDNNIAEWVEMCEEKNLC